MLEKVKEKIKLSLKGLEELKYKYVKRTGSPGNYQYWYKDPKTGKLEVGKKPSESGEEKKPKEGKKPEEKLTEKEKDEEYEKASKLLKEKDIKFDETRRKMVDANLEKGRDVKWMEENTDIFKTETDKEIGERQKQAKYKLVDPSTGKADLYADSMREAKFLQQKFHFSGLKIESNQKKEEKKSLLNFI